jgi:putative ABC transport system permease protein
MRRMTVWRTAPWRRAPWLLLRRPAVLAAVAGTFALLGIAAASGPLFLSSAGAAALQRRVAAQCPEADRPVTRAYLPATGRELDEPPFQLDGPQTDAAGERLRAAATAVGLPAPYRVTIYDVVADFGRPRSTQPLTVYSRADALDHVRKLRGGGEGLWVSDLTVERWKVRLGDTVQVGTLRMPIVGVYQDLAGRGFGATVEPYWCTWSARIVPDLFNRPPPFLLADPVTAARLVTAQADQGLPEEPTDAGVLWYSPVDTASLTLAEADRVTDRVARTSRALGPWFSTRSRLPDDVARARDTRDGVRGAITPVALAGIGVAVLLVGAAASFWVDQRRSELRLLAARGAGPGALAGKALLELAPAAVVGTAVGWLAAIPLVRVVGPASQLEPGAAGTALRAVLPALVAGLLALAAVAAARTAERHRRRRLIVPWELVLLGLAGWAYARLHGRDAVVVDVRAVVRVDPLLVAFGLLGTTGAVLLAARLLTALLPYARRRTAGAATAVHLAVRRLAGLRTATAAVVVATAVPVAILGYAGTVTRSTDATVTAKARTYAGTERAVVLNALPAETLPVGATGTQVSVVRDVRSPTGGTEDEVLGVDPATFARFAYGDVPGADVASLVARLRGPGVPAIAVGCRACGDQVALQLGRTTLRATVVGRANLFPGLRVRDAALFVLPRTALAGVDPYANRVEEVWTTADRLPAAVAALEAVDRPPRGEVSPGQFLGATQLLPVTWTFGYLQALAGLIGLIAVAGLFLFLSARQRSTLVAYVLLRRIGLSRRGHLGSLAGELAVVLGLGWLLGTLAAVGFAAAVRGLLDVNPLYPPGALLVVPVLVLTVGALVLLVVAAAGALATQRVADAADPATLLRGSAD